MPQVLKPKVDPALSARGTENRKKRNAWGVHPNSMSARASRSPSLMKRLKAGRRKHEADNAIRLGQLRYATGSSYSTGWGA